MSIPSIPERQRRSRKHSGFTLIEIMVVIAIIGLLLTFVAPSVYNNLRKANVTATKAKMTNLKNYIAGYRIQHSRVPDRLDDLLQPNEKNFNEPYVEDADALKDAWGNDFLYERITSSRFDIISLGADGMEGGEEDDADIHSLQDSMPR